VEIGGCADEQTDGSGVYLDDTRLTESGVTAWLGIRTSLSTRIKSGGVLFDDLWRSTTAGPAASAIVTESTTILIE
jgi:hypothetical protein